MPAKPDLYQWTYQEQDLNEYMAAFGIAEGSILRGRVGPALKVITEVNSALVGKIHSIAVLHYDDAYSNVRFITHHDSINTLYRFNRVNPLQGDIGPYFVGFATMNDWFLDPWTAYRVAMELKQIHPSIYTQERRALYTHEPLFDIKPKKEKT